MTYTISQLAQLSGVTPRTLRYYDQIGLLKPQTIRESGYRVYGTAEVDRLQQILFYRAMALSLEQIREILDDPAFDRQQALQDQLNALEAQERQLKLLIQNVKNTLQSMKGAAAMTDSEKFSGFIQNLVKENENTYGEEVRARFGDDAMDAYNQNLAGMSPEKWARQEALQREIATLLFKAVEEGDPAGKTAWALCGAHKAWLLMFWPEASYSPKAHAALAQGYVADPRFCAFYDKIVPGGAAFLRDALVLFCRE